tara:strand:+ start:265 stop:417 length:153 start_codon:yes stop_codon:yes gene_type:complete
MDKLTGYIVALIGILLVLPLIGVDQLAGAVTDWITALGVLVIGVKLILAK